MSPRLSGRLKGALFVTLFVATVIVCGWWEAQWL